MEFQLAYSIDTIGPFQLEFVIALLIAAALARLAALLAWRVRDGISDTARRLVYGGLFVALLALVLVALPAVLLAWLYSLSHPNALVCTFLVWPGLLLPVVIYTFDLWRFARRDRSASAAERA